MSELTIAVLIFLGVSIIRQLRWNRRSKLHKSILTLGLAFTLTACLGGLPEVVRLQVINFPEPNQGSCDGSLQAALSVGSLFLESEASFRDVATAEAGRLADARAGTIATIEAWCYGANNQEVGYFKLEKPWHASVANWDIFVHPSLENRETCLVGTEERGAAPCVSSGLLE